ncbi:MAG TPA: acyloxyacyl hydrolase [Terriglobales bacterium]|nr:acyloxyacyl hydrolase [Terriglobales bacterium]
MRKLAILLLLSANHAFAQNSSASWDMGAWFAGGHSVPGGTSGVGVFDAGVRLGKVLTGAHGPGLLRGSFEYAIDLVPLYEVHQSSWVYGAGFNPVNLKWNFTSRERFTPYLELGGGTLFSTHDVPAGTNTVNFRTHAALGIHILHEHKAGAYRGPTFEVRYEHISNAGLASPNPGINSLQFVIGWSHFSDCPPGAFCDHARPVPTQKP